MSRGKGMASRKTRGNGTSLSCSNFIFERDFRRPGRCVILRDVSEAGDAAHLPADHVAQAGPAGGGCAETRKRRAFSVSRYSGGKKAGVAFFAAHLVQTNC